MWSLRDYKVVVYKIAEKFAGISVGVSHDSYEACWIIGWFTWYMQSLLYYLLVVYSITEKLTVTGLSFGVSHDCCNIGSTISCYNCWILSSFILSSGGLHDSWEACWIIGWSQDPGEDCFITEWWFTASLKNLLDYRVVLHMIRASFAGSSGGFMIHVEFTELLSDRFLDLWKVWWINEWYFTWSTRSLMDY